MTTVPTNPKRCDSNQDSAPKLKVLIAYESVEIGLQALHLYQRVVKKFDPDYRFQLDLWKFEALGVPSLGKHAAREAVAADLVIIASNRDDRVPLDLRSWMESWTESKIGQDSALVHLSKRSVASADSAAPMLAYLRDVADRGSMTFLPDSIKAAGGEGDGFMEQIRGRNVKMPSVRENGLDRVNIYAHWGINE